WFLQDAEKTYMDGDLLDLDQRRHVGTASVPQRESGTGQLDIRKERDMQTLERDITCVVLPQHLDESATQVRLQQSSQEESCGGRGRKGGRSDGQERADGPAVG